MTATELQWEESGRGMAPHLQRVASTPESRTRAAFNTYLTHARYCRRCLDGASCEEGDALGRRYLEIYQAEGGVPHVES